MRPFAYTMLISNNRASFDLQWKENLVMYEKVSEYHKNESRFKRKRVGVRFKDGICAELCLKLWFESNWYFCNITESEWFWKRLSRNNILNNQFLKPVQKQPYADVFQNRRSWKFRNIHRKTSVLDFFKAWRRATSLKSDANTSVFL